MTVLITGGGGMLGRNILAAWDRKGHDEEVIALSRSDVDLLKPETVEQVLREIKPRLVIHCAAVVAGFLRRRREPFKFLHENAAIDSSVIGAALRVNVRNFLYLGSALIYPPTEEVELSSEERFLTSGFPALTDNYGLAKAVGSRQVQSAAVEFDLSYRVVVPTNLYGPHDHFSLEGAHVIPAALMKAIHARDNREELTVLGNSLDRRQFTYAPDLADWLVGVCRQVGDLPILLNVGAETVSTIGDVYSQSARVVGGDVPLRYDLSVPASASSQLIDSSRAKAFGWSKTTSLTDGIAKTYEWYVKHGK